MNIKKMGLGIALCLTSFSGMLAKENPLWLRYNVISPDGNTIAFTYMGDIYTVSASGGEARQLTSNGFNTTPKWSLDGTKLAFSSDREGGMDVFVMNADGTEKKRITTHSELEFPVAWSDDSHVILSRYGQPTPQDMVFPSGAFYRLYVVSENGGRQRLYSALSMDDLSLDKKGRALFMDVKGYEDRWRKHHTSAITRDVWLYADGRYSKITDFKGEDRNPVWNSDGTSFYYLSEKNGSMNVFERVLQSGEEKQLTHFTFNPVRYLSVSNNNVLSFSYDGALYTMRPGNEPQKVNIRLNNDAEPKELVRTLTSYGATSICVSPKGKEVAFTLNGDVYVTSMDYATTKQITDTPERESHVDFREDGRALVYDSERNGVWSVYQTELTVDDEKQFAYATQIKESCLTDGKTTSYEPKYSPDGKEVAYLENRTTLRVLNLKNGKVRTVRDGKYAYSYSDFDQEFSWSPDGKWLLANYIGTGGYFTPDVAIFPADGKGEAINVTQSGYSEGNARWVMNGRAILFMSDRAGYRSHGSWGAQQDVYITFLDPKAYEEFRMNKEDMALAKESDEKKSEKEEKKDSLEKVKNIEYDFTGMDMRTMRLTLTSGSIYDAVMDREGTKLYYIASFNGSTGLWVRDFKENSHVLKVPGVGAYSLDVDREGNTCYYIGGGGTLQKLNLSSMQSTNIPFETFSSTYPKKRYAYYFDHMWRQVKERLYDPDMNGTNWDSLYTVYKRFLPHINNGIDYSEMMGEMLGELNVSHTGCRYPYRGAALPTASLGVLYDESYQGKGVRIAEVLEGGPLQFVDKVKAGSIITAIDGVEIGEEDDFYPLLAGKAGINTRLTFKGLKEDVVIRPIRSQADLLYRRWVRRNEHLVDSLSGGRLAYVHIQGMNSESYREVYKNLLNDKNRNREAVIVDTRHNGGGWLHDDVCDLLSGKLALKFMPRGQFVSNSPFTRWTKPSCMLVCEDNYSDAHGTPWMYKEYGIGKLIGTPVAGTMTAVWWETIDGFTYGIPQVTTVDNRGAVLENQDLLPDVECYVAPEVRLSGGDTQIEVAVKELLGK